MPPPEKKILILNLKLSNSSHSERHFLQFSYLLYTQKNTAFNRQWGHAPPAPWICHCYEMITRFPLISVIFRPSQPVLKITHSDRELMTGSSLIVPHASSIINFIDVLCSLIRFFLYLLTAYWHAVCDLHVICK